MENAIVIIILSAVTGFILRYLRKEKKHGKKCIGCPYAKQCENSRK